MPPSFAAHPFSAEALTAYLKVVSDKEESIKFTPDAVFIKFARWATRSVCPEIDWTAAVAFGLREETDINPPQKRLTEAEKRQQRIAVVAWDALQAEHPDSKALLQLLAAQPEILDKLTARMSAAGGARSEDISSLRDAGLEYITRQMPEGELNPFIPYGSSKQAHRGWIHPQIRELLLPMNLRTWYLADPEGAIAKIKNRDTKVTGRSLPSFLYAREAWDEYRGNDVRKGLLENPLPLLVFKHLFTCPSSARAEEFIQTKTRKGQARLHGLNYVTPQTFAYAIVHTYHMLCGSGDWRNEDSDFDRLEFFENLVYMFTRENPWNRNIFEKLSYKVFGGHPFQKGSEWDTDTDDNMNDFALFVEQCEQDGKGKEKEQVGAQGKDDDMSAERGAAEEDKDDEEENVERHRSPWTHSPSDKEARLPPEPESPCAREPLFLPSAPSTVPKQGNKKKDRANKTLRTPSRLTPRQRALQTTAHKKLRPEVARLLAGMDEDESQPALPPRATHKKKKIQY